MWYHCSRCFRPLPVTVLVLVAWSYYAYAYEMCIVKMTSTVKKVIYLIILHALLIVVLVHYFMTMCVWTGEVPDEYKFSNAAFYAIKDLEEGDPAIAKILKSFCKSKGITTYTRKHNCIRYCLKCRHVKPDRTHHCSTCEMCVLKMDHHCPWLHGCVGFTNYKLFLLLLVYSILYCVFYAVTSFEYVYVYIARSGERTWWQMNYVLGFLFASTVAILLMVLLSFHWGSLVKNETTIEAMSDPNLMDNCTYDLGNKLDNILEVFGYNWCLWCLPVYTSLGDGVEFPMICP